MRASGGERRASVRADVVYVQEDSQPAAAAVVVPPAWESGRVTEEWGSSEVEARVGATCCQPRDKASTPSAEGVRMPGVWP